MRISLILATAALLFGSAARAASPASSPHDVPEPQGLYQGAPHGYTPARLTGATVLDTAALTKLMQQHPVLIDVALEDRKPPSMMQGMVWLPQHRSIPGAVWLPGGGSGTADPAFSASFRNRAASLTHGDTAAPVVVFCHPDCWGSYNAAKRLVGLGYVHVYWYPAGMEGWQDEHDTAIIKPDQNWVAALPQDLTH